MSDDRDLIAALDDIVAEELADIEHAEIDPVLVAEERYHDDIAVPRFGLLPLSTSLPDTATRDDTGESNE